jgi:hypothetical protein
VDPDPQHCFKQLRRLDHQSEARWRRSWGQVDPAADNQDFLVSQVASILPQQILDIRSDVLFWFRDTVPYLKKALTVLPLY